jgi:hypothetical protein
MNKKDFFGWVQGAKSQPEYKDFDNTRRANDPLNDPLHEANMGDEVPLVQTGPGTVPKPTDYSKMVYASDIPKKNKDKKSFIERIVTIIGGLRK